MKFLQEAHKQKILFDVFGYWQILKIMYKINKYYIGTQKDYV